MAWITSQLKPRKFRLNAFSIPNLHVYGNNVMSLKNIYFFVIERGMDMKKERDNFWFYKYIHIFWFISKISNF